MPRGGRTKPSSAAMASVKSLAKTWFEHATGARVFPKLPRGVDVMADMARWLPNHAVTVAFDVGANKGQSATENLEAFPYKGGERMGPGRLAASATSTSCGESPS